MGDLFGTDGVRGEVNYTLTPELAFSLGLAGGYILTKENKHAPKILIGTDTRVSCDMIEASLISGMCSVGADVYIAGVIPTPAIAYLTKKFDFDAGVVISASHNLFQDNGIKFFNSDGYKLPDNIEKEIEEVIKNNLNDVPRAKGNKVGRKHIYKNALNEYINFIKSTINEINFKNLKIAIDCANGSTYKVAPRIFKELGADVYIINDKPTGYNINENCGSTHMKELQEFVKNNGMNIGVAFDGDGDRCLIVDNNGKVIDGDEIMSILSFDLKQKNKLNDNTLVATVMSNLGLFIMGEQQNINIEKTAVGDRYVLEKMLEGGFNLGGEQSGHIIFLDYNTTGDGILTAIQLIKIMKEKESELSNINNLIKVLPQVIINTKVNNEKKYSYLEYPEISNYIKNIENEFSSSGRVLVRASGTESLVRIMIEGQDELLIRSRAIELSKIIEKFLL